MIATFLIVVLILITLMVSGLMIFSGWIARQVEAAIPPVGRFVDVDGVRLHYVDQGSGPVVVMIHGLGAQLQSFTFALSAHLPHYRLIMLDRPGAGYSQACPSSSLKAQAALISAFLETLGIDRVLVAGHSLGGAVSLALAVDHPARVAGLALFAPLTQFQEQVPEALKSLAIRSDMLRWIIGWTLAAPLSMRAGPRTMNILFAPDPAPKDFGTRGGGLLTLRPWTFRNASRDLEVAFELPAYGARYKEIGVPVGVLFGTGDRILDHKLHGETLLGVIPDIDLELIEHGGHMVPLSAPERSAAFIERMAAKAGLRLAPMAQA